MADVTGVKITDLTAAGSSDLYLDDSRHVCHNRFQLSLNSGGALLVADQPFRPGHDAACVACSSASGDLAAFQKQHECRNAANAIACRQRLLFLGVDLEKPVVRF